MTNTLTCADGLYISTQATWLQLATDKTLGQFANGLISMTLNGHHAPQTLAEVLYDSDPLTHPLLTALLVLDAEVNAVVGNKQPVFPLPGFLTYRSKLPPDKFPLNAIRLPLAHPNAHYVLGFSGGGFCSAIRLNLHPTLNTAGNVRIAISSPIRSPVRLTGIEYCLERQVLTEELIQAAVAEANEDLLKPLAPIEQIHLSDVLQGFLTAKE